LTAAGSWERDGGHCTFVSVAGHRCQTRKFLEYDHAVEEVEQDLINGETSATAPSRHALRRRHVTPTRPSIRRCAPL
jgi:hypothetical protein